jgi:hypothetical protein
VRIWQNCARATIENLDKEEMRFKKWLVWLVKWQQHQEMYKCFKWALWNDFYMEDLWRQYKVFMEVAENGHINILEWADIKEMHWYQGNALVPPKNVG